VGWLDILKIDKNSTDLQCFMFQFGGLAAFFGGPSPPKFPRGDGTGFRFRTGVIKLSLAMYPFSILIDEHVPLTFFMTKWLWKITRMYLPISIH